MRRRKRYPLVVTIFCSVVFCTRKSTDIIFSTYTYISISMLHLSLTDVTNEINKQIAMNSIGRMFAVVQVCGKQFKVTENDIIIIEGYWPPSIGDKLKLEKVLLVGSTDFTLVGRPMLNRELVTIDATVVEKTLSHTKTRFKFRPRKQYRRIHCKASGLIFFYSPCFLSVNIINILLLSLQNTTYDATNQLYKYKW